MEDTRYIKLTEKVNRLEAEINTQKELIDILTDALVLANGNIAKLEEMVYTR